MLQPVQLREVAQRFPGEIDTLRAFFSQAGIPLHGVDAIHHIALRVVQDRAFHRDLMSHVWVILDESGTGMPYADLLGIVAIAAAGVPDAARTGEDDAHTLLRFLMEAKHTLEGTPQTQPLTPAGVPLPATEEAQHPPPGVPQSEAEESDSRRMPQRSAQAPPKKIPLASPRALVAEPVVSHRRFRPIHAAGLLGAAIAIFLGYLLLRPRSTPINSAPHVGSNTPPGALIPHSAESRNSSPLPRTGNNNVTTTTAEPRVPKTPQQSVPPAQTEASLFEGPSISGASATTPATSHPGPDLPRPEVPSTTASASLRSSGPTTSTERQPATSSKSSRSDARVPTPIAADTISTRLDSPRLPAYAFTPEETGRKYPRLLRRQNPNATGDTSSDAVLSAELRAPDITAPSSSSARTAKAAPAAHGIVRSTCLGMMAGNLVYSPTPPYPAAAAAARVQGEVKVQATIDRDGSINGARVISGPPLLRDAALDAIQHWRYKPYLAGGKPVPTGTLAVVEFELQ